MTNQEKTSISGKSPVSWRPRLPDYLKRPIPSGPAFARIQGELDRTRFPTVCREAECPNRTDCWSRGTLSFQILGSVCTRRCAFCAETSGRPGAVDVGEPGKLVEAVRVLRLSHVVVTSPARDDLADQGAGQFSSVVRALHAEVPGVTVEVLTPDFQGRSDLLKIIFDARPDVFNHNVETVRRLSPQVRALATYDRSLSVLKAAAESGLAVKSGLMVGLGEKREELLETFHDLQRVGVRALTVGQYLPPGPRFFPVDRFYSLEEFRDIKAEAGKLFEKVMVGPLVRSSYHADELVKL